MDSKKLDTYTANRHVLPAYLTDEQKTYVAYLVACEGNFDVACDESSVSMGTVRKWTTTGPNAKVAKDFMNSIAYVALTGKIQPEGKEPEDVFEDAYQEYVKPVTATEVLNYWRDRLNSDGKKPEVVATLPKTLKEQQRNAIFGAIVATNGNGVEAAQKLGMGKTTLYRQLREAFSMEDGEEMSISKIHQELLKKGVKPSTEIIPLKTIEANAIRDAMFYTKGNIDKAANILGIGRNTIYRREALAAFAGAGAR